MLNATFHLVIVSAENNRMKPPMQAVQRNMRQVFKSFALHIGTGLNICHRDWEMKSSFRKGPGELWHFSSLPTGK